MIDFKGIANRISVRDYAESIGMKISRNGMTLCPFHDDRNPSMKADKRFHCFACGADGDVINFVARLYGIRNYEAALKISAEFNISEASETDNTRTAENKINARDLKNEYMQYLIFAEKEFKKWLTDYRPPPAADRLHPLFVTSLQKIEYTSYLIDCLSECRTEDEIFHFISHFGKEVII